MPEKTYACTIAEKPYTLELNYTWRRLSLRANGVTLIDTVRYWLLVKDMPFTLDGHPGFLRNWGIPREPCNLVVDNISIIDGKEYPPLLPMPWWGRLFQGAAGLILLVGIFFLLAPFFYPERRAIPYIGYLFLNLSISGLFLALILWLVYWVDKKVDFDKRDPSVRGIAIVLGLFLASFFNVYVRTALFDYLDTFLLPNPYYFDELGAVRASLGISLSCIAVSALLYQTLSFHPRDPDRITFARIVACAGRVFTCWVVISCFFNIFGYSFILGPIELASHLFSGIKP